MPVPGNNHLISLVFETATTTSAARAEVNGAPTGARVPFVRVPSYQGEFARVERCPGKTNARVESYQGGKLSGAIYPGAKSCFCIFFTLVSSFLKFQC